MKFRLKHLFGVALAAAILLLGSYTQAAGYVGLAPMPSTAPGPEGDDAVAINCSAIKTTFDYEWNQFAAGDGVQTWKQKRDYRFYAPRDRITYQSTFQAAYMCDQDWCYNGNWEYAYKCTQRYYFTEWVYGGGYGVPHTVYEKTIVITQSGELIESNWNVITGSALQSVNAVWESALNLYWARVQWFETNTAYNKSVGKTSTTAWVNPNGPIWLPPKVGELWVGDSAWSLYHDDAFDLETPKDIKIDPLQDGWNFIVNEARITGWIPLLP